MQFRILSKSMIFSVEALSIFVADKRFPPLVTIFRLFLRKYHFTTGIPKIEPCILDDFLTLAILSNV